MQLSITNQAGFDNTERNRRVSYLFASADATKWQKANKLTRGQTFANGIILPASDFSSQLRYRTRAFRYHPLWLSVHAFHRYYKINARITSPTTMANEIKVNSLQIVRRTFV